MEVKDVVKIFREVYEVEKKIEEVKQVFREAFDRDPEYLDPNRAIAVDKISYLNGAEMCVEVEEVYKTLGLSPCVEECGYGFKYEVKRTEYSKPEDFYRDYVAREIDSKLWYISKDYPEMVSFPRNGFVAKVTVYKTCDDC